MGREHGVCTGKLLVRRENRVPLQGRKQLAGSEEVFDDGPLIHFLLLWYFLEWENGVSEENLRIFLVKSSFLKWENQYFREISSTGGSVNTVVWLRRQTNCEQQPGGS